MPDGSVYASITLDKADASKPANDKALLATIKASEAMCRASGQLAGIFYDTGDMRLFSEFQDRNGDLTSKMFRQVRAALPVTEAGVKAKRKFLVEHDGTEHDDGMLALCGRYLRISDELAIHGKRHSNYEGARAELVELRLAIAAGKCMNMETVVARARVALREAEGTKPCSPQDEFCRAVLAELVKVGGVL